MRLFLATKNQKKLNEMQRILEPLGIEVLSECNSEYKIEEVKETGKTFAENARLKAESALKCTCMPSVADDSGLCVDFLGGAPGIYSARFAGDGHDDDANNAKLLKLLESVPDSKRNARFVSAICCIFPNGDTICAEGICEGKIARVLSGNGGFGYDPLFLCGEKTFAEFTDEEKDKVSHRGRALSEFVCRLQKYIGENKC